MLWLSLQNAWECLLKLLPSVVTKKAKTRLRKSLTLPVTSNWRWVCSELEHNWPNWASVRQTWNSCPFLMLSWKHIQYNSLYCFEHGVFFHIHALLGSFESLNFLVLCLQVLPWSCWCFWYHIVLKLYKQTHVQDRSKASRSDPALTSPRREANELWKLPSPCLWQTEHLMAWWGKAPLHVILSVY